MKAIFKSAAVLFLAINLYAQSENRIVAPVDTVLRYQGIVLPSRINYNFDNMMFLPETNLFNSEQLPVSDSSTIWLMTELSLSNPVYLNENTGNYFTEPLYRQYQENSKFSIVSYVLGVAQAGAVGYMAYRHIKKYGFIK